MQTYLQIGTGTHDVGCRGQEPTRSQYVWHDDGTVPDGKPDAHIKYQRDRTNDITTYGVSRVAVHVDVCVCAGGHIAWGD